MTIPGGREWPKRALDAFIHTTAESEDGAGRLKKILSDISNGTIGDPDNELLASLLAALYPREIPPSEIWRYLTTKGNADLIGAYFVFWERRVLEQSSRPGYCGAPRWPERTDTRSGAPRSGGITWTVCPPDSWQEPWKAWAMNRNPFDSTIG